MGLPAIDAALAGRLYERARAGRWRLSRELWAGALEASATRAFADRAPTPRELDRYLAALHLEDLALACACAAGDESAWDYFMREHRPVLYRSAGAIDPADGRELADSLYADLYGLTERDGARQSLFRHFHGRSTLATWLRAVLAQRHVDRIRASRRVDRLPDDESHGAIASRAEPADPERFRYVALIERALTLAVAGLAARDRLRLGWYYAQGMTLASIGRLLDEHEATVSRHLARSRRRIRRDIENHLRGEGLTDAEMAACLETVLDDAGPIDLRSVLASGDVRKKSDADRSVLRRGTL
jgi:RNA polymerase sigma-70 factor (ECF subfamily)